MISIELVSDIKSRLFELSSSELDGASMVVVNEKLPHEVLVSPFMLEIVFSFLHPRTLCAAARVNSTWNGVAYSQRALWSDWNITECLISGRPSDLLHPRFGKLKAINVPASFVNAHGTQNFVCSTHGRQLFECKCQPSVSHNLSGDIKDYLRENHFTDLRSLRITIPPHRLIDPSLLTQFTNLTSLCIENLNPKCASAYSALVTSNTHLRTLTYLTRPWEGNNNSLPFSLAGLNLEKLEVNQIDLEDILHMTATLKSLKINGYPEVDKDSGQLCLKSVEELVSFTQLEELDISGVAQREVDNPPYVAMYVCMLTHVKTVRVGPLFSMEDFSWMFRDMTNLTAVAIYDSQFSNTNLQDFASSIIAPNIVSLHLHNCIYALTEPDCLTSFVKLRTLHIEQDPPRHGGTMRKLVPALLRMTELRSLALVGLNINAVSLYSKLTRLERLVLNFTPSSDADILIISKKLPHLRHLGLLGNPHVTCKVLLTLLAAIPLDVLEWDEPMHIPALLAVNKELSVITYTPKQELQHL